MGEMHMHSFIIKLWGEEAVDLGGQTVWHGHITHVGDGKRHSLHDLTDIRRCIQPYLANASRRAFRPDQRWRLFRHLGWQPR